jgi:hypothetical protein
MTSQLNAVSSFTTLPSINTSTPKTREPSDALELRFIVRMNTGVRGINKSGSEVHPASCTMGTKGPFPGGKARPGRDADHSPPSSAEVENE